MLFLMCHEKSYRKVQISTWMFRFLNLPLYRREELDKEVLHNIGFRFILVTLDVTSVFLIPSLVLWASRRLIVQNVYKLPLLYFSIQDNAKWKENFKITKHRIWGKQKTRAARQQEEAKISKEQAVAVVHEVKVWQERDSNPRHRSDWCLKPAP